MQASAAQLFITGKLEASKKKNKKTYNQTEIYFKRNMILFQIFKIKDDNGIIFFFKIISFIIKY